jgi:hypothetical protein
MLHVLQCLRELVNLVPRSLDGQGRYARQGLSEWLGDTRYMPICGH